MSDSDSQDKEVKSIRSPDFRYIPCDSINLALSHDGVKIVLGVNEMDGSTLELSGVHMTHRTAQILRNMLARALDQYQTDMGVEIPAPSSKDFEGGK